MDKKTVIIEAALKLLVTKGIHASPMSAIAKAANTGMGTIYNYFATKEILINSIYVHIKRQEKDILIGLISDDKVENQLKRYYNAVVDFFTTNKVYFDFFQQLNNSPLISKESEAEGLNSILPVIEILQKGQDNKAIKNISIEELLQFIGGVVIANLSWKFTQKDSADKSLNNDNYFNLLWDGIKA